VLTTWHCSDRLSIHFVGSELEPCRLKARRPRQRLWPREQTGKSDHFCLPPCVRRLICHIDNTGEFGRDSLCCVRPPCLLSPSPFPDTWCRRTTVSRAKSFATDTVSTTSR
jgi:hypothetical protein